MDGVIVDGETIQSKSLEILLRKYGKKPKYNKNGLVHTVGIAGDQSYKEFIKNYHLKEPIETLRKERRKIFVKLIGKKLKPIPGFNELISRFKKSGFKMALASNRFIDHVFIMVKNLGADSYFDVIHGPSDGANIKLKPEPDIYLEVAKKLKIFPQQCVVLEDSEYGVIAGYAAGMKVIAIPTRYTKHQNFQKADKIVKSLSDITIPMINSL